VPGLGATYGDASLPVKRSGGAFVAIGIVLALLVIGGGVGGFAVVRSRAAARAMEAAEVRAPPSAEIVRADPPSAATGSAGAAEPAPPPSAAAPAVSAAPSATASAIAVPDPRKPAGPFPSQARPRPAASAKPPPKPAGSVKPDFGF
jgi:hypothetical protein